mgnify:FL=1
MPPEHHEHRQKRFARIRRAKLFLRFMPRKARFHRYPLIGRFADMARKRDYLWSFRTESVRPALYIGSIVALLPLLGIQVAVAFVLALMSRANVMLLIGLQFVTTPITAPPLYYGTYHVGRVVMEAVGFEPTAEHIGSEAALIQELETMNKSITAPDQKWSTRWGSTIVALMVGGLVVGTFVGFVLDMMWRFASGRAEVRKIRRAVQKMDSGSTPSPTTPK